MVCTRGSSDSVELSDDDDDGSSSVSSTFLSLPRRDFFTFFLPESLSVLLRFRRRLVSSPDWVRGCKVVSFGIVPLGILNVNGLGVLGGVAMDAMR
jgi:hypothetical protein